MSHEGAPSENKNVPERKSLRGMVEIRGGMDDDIPNAFAGLKPAIDAFVEGNLASFMAQADFAAILDEKIPTYISFLEKRAPRYGSSDETTEFIVSRSDQEKIKSFDVRVKLCNLAREEFKEGLTIFQAALRADTSKLDEKAKKEASEYLDRSERLAARKLKQLQDTLELLSYAVS